MHKAENELKRLTQRCHTAKYTSHPIHDQAATLVQQFDNGLTFDNWALIYFCHILTAFFVIVVGVAFLFLAVTLRS